MSTRICMLKKCLATQSSIIYFLYIEVYYTVPAAAAAKSPQSCPTLCDPIEGSPLGSSVPGIPQARKMPESQ